MRTDLVGYFGKLATATLAGLFLTTSAQALDRIRIHVEGNDGDLEDAIVSASLVVAAKTEGRTEADNVFASALSDYARLLDVLYAEGYYGGVINIYVDGREAAATPLLRAPDRITEVAINVRPGRPFRFGDARIGPLAPGTEIPEGFAPGQPARAPVVRSAVDAAADGWREASHAKVEVAGERVVADHENATLDSVIALNPGPPVKFGSLVIQSESRVRAEAIRRIAGLDRGDPFSPEEAKRVADRLRRAGAWRAVALEEADTLSADGEMDMLLTLEDAKRRRIGVGAEVSSLDGGRVTAFWMHRNIFGGAERLRFDAEVANIGSGNSGMDYTLGGRLTVPAPIGPETTAFTYGTLERLDEADYLSEQVEVGFGITRRVGGNFQLDASLAYFYSETEDALGERTFSLFKLPISATYDRRDDTLNPKEGFYVNLDITPFVGLNDTESGVRTYGDARGYYGFGADQRVVLAGRLQFGSIAGASTTGTHPDMLFYSGGSGTVRGHPYQSLNVDLGGGDTLGGRSFLGFSAEVRTEITDTIGLVAFADAGYIGAEQFYDGSGDWHSGAGLGVRYMTGIGPIRFDVAYPTSGDTGDGVQIYIGIGQAF